MPTATRFISRIQDCDDYADALTWAGAQTFNAGISVANNADADMFTYLRSGQTTNYRNYFYWMAYDSVVQWAFGRNAANSIILFDNPNSNHRIVLDAGAKTRINSGGSDAVVLNAYEEADNGTGGLEVYSGGATPTLWGSINSTGFYSQGLWKLEDTTTSTTGVLYKGTDRWIHNFHHPTGGGAVPIGKNTFIGVNAGNFTLTATAGVYEGSKNVAVGDDALDALTTGYQNLAVGQGTLGACTTGQSNVGVGASCLLTLTTAVYNTAVGYGTLQNCNNHRNSAFGYAALNLLTSGGGNVGVGFDAGRYLANGSDPNQTTDNSVYLGRETKASADGADNEVVIGYEAIGSGTNTITLGGSAITDTIVPYGSVGIGTASPDRLLHAEVSDAVTDAVTYGLRLSHITSGTAAAGFGTGIEFELEDAGGGNDVLAAIQAIETDATAGAEHGALVFLTADIGDDGLVERARIDHDGKVGIGTAAPDTNLHIKQPTTGATKLRLETVDSDSQILFERSGGTYFSIRAPAVGGVGSFGIYDDDDTTWRFNIDPSGNVGIGASSPDRLLHAEVSDAVTAAVTYAQRLSHITSGTAAAGFGTGIEFELEDAGGGFDVAATIESVWTDAAAAAEDGALVFKVAGHDTLREALRLEGDNTVAQVGFFGTAPQSQQAHIADAAAAAGDPPTQAEFNALVAKFNTLLADLEGYGLLASA
jgi:hypothetical protein